METRSRQNLRLFVCAGLLLGTACGVNKDAHQAVLDKNRDLSRQNQELEAANRKLAQVDPRLADLQRRDTEQAARIANLRKFVEGVRNSLGGRGVAVTIRNGRMIVTVPEAILFESGKAELTGTSPQVLGEMATLIRGTAGWTFRVSGHTDNVPIKTSKFPSNWELSTARAVAVVHFLVGKGNDPKTLAAGGRADNEPIGDNSTEQGRAANRRIEFVLEPDLSELPDLSAALKTASS